MAAPLVLAFLAVPVVELYLFFTVSHYIGLGTAFVILLGTSILGAMLVKREGRRAWVSLRETVARGALPGREVADGALVLIGGALLLTPGFLTDLVGLLFVLRLTRPLARAAVLRVALGRSRQLRRPGAGRVIDVPPAERRPP